MLIALATVAILLFPDFSAVAQSSRTASASYPAPVDWWDVECGPGFDPGNNAGAVGDPHVVFETHPGETSVKLVIDDVNPASSAAALVNQTGRFGEGHVVCGQHNLPIHGGRSLYLWVFQRTNDSSASAAGGGRIEATFFTSSNEPTPSASPSSTAQPSPPPEPERVGRVVDLDLRRHLRGVGVVFAKETACRDGVPIVVHRKSARRWVGIGRATTGDEGRFELRLGDREGRYRAVVPRVSNVDTLCTRSASDVVRHRHR